MWSVVVCLAAIAPALLTSAGSTPSSDVSHEDIRDAILSLVNIFRDNSEKLERHEYRERQLGEQLKKAIAGLDKRYRIQDQSISDIGERLKSLETKLIQKEEREQLQMLKISDTVESIQKTVGSVMKDLEAGSKGGHAAYTVQEGPLETPISARLPQTSASSAFDEHSKRSLQETERIVRNIERKLESGISSPNSEHGSDLSKEFQKQSHILDNIFSLAAKTSEVINKLPQKWEIQEIVNGTADSLQEMREDLLSNDDKGLALVLMKLDEKAAALITGQDDLMKTTTEIQTMAEGFNNGIIQSYEQLLSEIKGLSKVEQVMIQTADNVMDTKRRIEYGVHQILLEVGDLVKHQGKSLNGTVNRRFDDIESTILDNQTGALSNLSSKIEQEISQVWRQIGIMYQQLTASATALDRLQQQTDAYVNGSVKTMDSMENKVGMITSRMTEVDENLNFLLGRLSLVTSEYNQIKSGLAGALDDIRDSFLQVQSKLKEVGPGPNPIPEKDIGNEVPSG